MPPLWPDLAEPGGRHRGLLAMLERLAINTLLLAIIGSWLTSAFICVKKMQIAMLIVTIFIPPVGVINGIGIIVGFW